MSMNAETAATCARVARTVARTLARPRPYIDPADLEQEAWAAMLPKLADYRAEAGSLGGYLHAIAFIACKRLIIKLGAVATIPRREAAKGEIQRQRATVASETVLEAMPEVAPLPVERLEQAQARERLAAIVAEHLAHGREGEAIKAVLSGDMRSSEAAETFGVPLSRLYQQTHATKKALRADRRLVRFV